MTDVRLRELEREVQRDPAREAELLAARVRAGALTRERLQVAAASGHGPARVALGWAPEETAPAVGAWLEALVRAGGREPLVRAALAAGGRALPVLEARLPDDPRARRCVEAAEHWLRCPCEPHEEAARRSASFAWITPEEAILAQVARVVSQPFIDIAEGQDAWECATAVVRFALLRVPGLALPELRAELVAWALSPLDPLPGVLRPA